MKWKGEGEKEETIIISWRDEYLLAIYLVVNRRKCFFEIPKFFSALFAETVVSPPVNGLADPAVRRRECRGRRLEGRKRRLVMAISRQKMYNVILCLRLVSTTKKRIDFFHKSLLRSSW